MARNLGSYKNDENKYDERKLNRKKSIESWIYTF